MSDDIVNFPLPVPTLYLATKERPVAGSNEHRALARVINLSDCPQFAEDGWVVRNLWDEFTLTQFATECYSRGRRELHAEMQAARESEAASVDPGATTETKLMVEAANALEQMTYVAQWAMTNGKATQKLYDVVNEALRGSIVVRPEDVVAGIISLILQSIEKAKRRAAGL